MSQTKAQLIDPVDGTIVNADINASAAIAGSKISPDFGSQNIVTTGSITGNDLEIDSGTLSVDASNNRVGIGTTSCDNTLHIERTSSNHGIKLERTGTNAGSALVTVASFGVLSLTADNNIQYKSGGSQQHMFFKGSDEIARFDTSKRLLIGTSASRAPQGINAALQVEGTDANTSSFSLIRNSANQHSPNLIFSKTRGTGVGSTTVVQNNDALGMIAWVGSDGSDSVSTAARITGAVDGTPGSDDMPGRLEFLTTADGATTPTERMRITASGLVGIGVTSPQRVLHVSKNDTPCAKFGGSGGSDYFIEIGQLTTSSSGGFNATGSSTSMLFQINGSEKMRLTNGGFLYVNKTSTSDFGRFEVKGGTADDIEASDIRTETVATFSGSTPGTTASGKGAGIVIKPIADRGCNFFIGAANGSSNQEAHGSLIFRSGNFASATAERLRIDPNGHLLPGVDNSLNLGSASKRWANLYTTDLKLSNEGSQNDVDSTWGNYTIQEGHEDLFLLNHRTGKKFKFNLTEVA